jgi:hypothetical protein
MDWKEGLKREVEETKRREEGKGGGDGGRANESRLSNSGIEAEVKSGVRHRFGNPLRACIRRYAPTESHVQHTRSSPSTMNVLARASLGPPPSIETGHSAVIAAAPEGGSP